MSLTLIKSNGKTALASRDGSALDPKVNELNKELDKVRETIDQEKCDINRAECEVTSIFEKVTTDSLSVEDALKETLTLEQTLETIGGDIKKRAFTVFAKDKDGNKYKHPVSPSVNICKLLIHTEDLPVSDEKAAFMAEVDRATMVIDQVFSPQNVIFKWSLDGRSAKHAEYLRELTGICHIGLEHETQLNLAKKSLESFQAAFFAKEAGTVKNKYLWRLGRRCLLLSGAATLAYIGVRIGLDAKDVLYRFRSFFMLLAGAGVGAWLSFTIRNPLKTFFDLAVLEQDRLDPTIRVLFIAALTSIVGLFIWTKAVSLGFGEFNTAGFETGGATALLIGLLLGISERAMATAVEKRATEFGAGIGGKDQSTDVERTSS